MSDSALLAEADSLFDRRQFDQAREIYMQVADSARDRGDNAALTEACAMIARTYLASDKKEEGRPWLEKAAERAAQAEPPGWSRLLSVRGRFEWKDDQLEKAAATFKELYQFCSRHNLHERAVDAANMMTIVGTPAEQIDWGMKGIREAEAGNVTRWLGPLWNNLGWTYEHDGKYHEAIDAYQHAREYHYRHGDQKNKLCADWALGHAYRLNGDTVNAAIWITPELLIEFEKLEDIEFQGWTLKEMGEIALLQDRSGPALTLLTKAKEKLEEAEMAKWDPENYRDLLIKIDRLKGKYAD